MNSTPSLGAVLSALADPPRRKVVTQLVLDVNGAEHPCGSFDLTISKATRTHQFKVLREAGLIDQRQHGNGSSVSLRRAYVEEHRPGLLTLLAREAEARRAAT